MNPLMISGVVIAVLIAACIGLFEAWDGAREDYLTEKARYSAFVGGVEVLGRAQEAKNEAERIKREKRDGDAIKALQGRYADLDARYGRLRDKAGGDTRSGILSSVPDTARPADDSARDQRLLDVLQHADRQTAQLIELQEWLRQQR